MLEQIRCYKTILKEAESTVFDKKSFSYTLGFNLKDGRIVQEKLYIRLFSKSPDLTLFFKLITDGQIQSAMMNGYNDWNIAAFSRKTMGFKGFTLMVGFDEEDDEEIVGYGGKMPTKDGVVFQASVFKKMSSKDLVLDKRTYYYKPKSIIEDFGIDLKYCTDTVETQCRFGQPEEIKKFCLCPEFNKDNIIKVSNSLRKNLKKESRKFNSDLVRQFPNLTLVNVGFDRDGGVKLYYHNFLSQNKIKGYL